MDEPDEEEVAGLGPVQDARLPGPAGHHGHLGRTLRRRGCVPRGEAVHVVGGEGLQRQGAARLGPTTVVTLWTPNSRTIQPCWAWRLPTSCQATATSLRIRQPVRTRSPCSSADHQVVAQSANT